MAMGCLHEKTRTGASFIPGRLFLMSYLVLMMTGSFHTSLFECTLHVDKNTRVIQNRKHYACTPLSSLPADRFHIETGGRFAFT